MKKIVSTILVSALALSLCACSSTPTQPTQENNQPQKSVDIVDETTREVLDGIPETSEAEHQIYSIDGMSSEDIFNMLISLSTGISTGDAVDKYAERFSVTPWSTSEGDTIAYEFWFPENTTNCITTIGFDNVQKEMNNTITIKEYSDVWVRLALKDYDTASDLYNRLYEYLCQNTPNQSGSPIDNREGTYWSSQVNCMVEDEYGSNFCYSLEVKLEQNTMTGNYDLTVRLPIK